MSLVGNLEDLSLGDLLQIVSLSQKSGVLALESEAGAGRIVFRAGLVHAAGIKGRSPDLRTVVVEAGLIEPAGYDALVASWRGRAAELPSLLARELGLDPDQLDVPIRKAAEAAVFEMFGWASGEFSFDAQREDAAEEPYPRLRSGINAQYLAMEGMRLRDEQSRGGPAPEIELSEELFFGSEPLEVDADAELELEAEITAGPTRPPRPAVAAEPAPEPASAPPAPPEPAIAAEPAPVLEIEPIVDTAVEVVAARAIARAESSGAPAPEPSISPQSRPIVVIDPDAVALEWLKTGIEGRFVRIHVFQRADQGLSRIRQYLIRGEVPFLLISLTTPIDPLSGIHGLPDFVKRLRAQAPRIVVVGLREGGEAQAESVPAYLDAVLTRPTRKQLRSAPAATEVATRAQQLAAELEQIVLRRG